MSSLNDYIIIIQGGDNLAIDKIDNFKGFTFNHKEQETHLYETKTAEQVKKDYDSRGEDLAKHLDYVVGEINKKNETQDEDLNTHKTSGDHDNRYMKIDDSYNKTEVENIVKGVTLGQIPPNSINESMMTADMKKDVAGGIVSHDKFNLQMAEITQEVKEEKFQPFTTNSSMTSLPNSVDGGILDIKRIDGRTLVNISNEYIEKEHSSTYNSSNNFTIDTSNINYLFFRMFVKASSGFDGTIFKTFKTNDTDWYESSSAGVKDITLTENYVLFYGKVDVTSYNYFKGILMGADGTTRKGWMKDFGIYAISTDDNKIIDQQLLEKYPFVKGVQSTKNVELACVTENLCPISEFNIDSSAWNNMFSTPKIQCTPNSVYRFKTDKEVLDSYGTGFIHWRIEEFDINGNSLRKYQFCTDGDGFNRSFSIGNDAFSFKYYATADTHGRKLRLYNVQITIGNEDKTYTKYDKSSFLLQDILPSTFTEEDKELREGDYIIDGNLHRKKVRFRVYSNLSWHSLGSDGGNTRAWASIPFKVYTEGRSLFHTGDLGSNGYAQIDVNGNLVIAVDNSLLSTQNTAGLIKYLDNNNIEVMPTLITEQVFELNVSPNLVTFENSNFQMKGRIPLLLDSNLDWTMSNENPDKTICQPYITIPPDFQDVVYITNDKGLVFNEASSFIGNAYQILHGNLYLQIFKSEMGFENSHIVTADEINSYLNQNPYKLVCDTKNIVLPTITGRYPLNVAGVRQSMAKGIENNSISLQANWDDNEIIKFMLANYIADDIAKIEEFKKTFFHEEEVTTTNAGDIKKGTIFTYAYDGDFPEELIVKR